MVALRTHAPGGAPTLRCRCVGCLRCRECFWPSVCLYICGIFLVTLLLCWLVFDLFQLLTEGLLDANGCRLAD